MPTPNRQLAVAKGLWRDELLPETVGYEPVCGRSIGRVFDHRNVIEDGKRIVSPMDQWYVYEERETSPGTANSLPSPQNAAPLYIASIVSDDSPWVTFRWRGAIFEHGFFRFQLSRHPNFEPLLLDEEIFWGNSVSFEPAEAGIYYWRVRSECLDDFGIWSVITPMNISFAFTEDMTP